MPNQPGETPPDYLIIGHITRDLHEDGSRLGGTAFYSSLLAQRLGLKVALFTSCERELSLNFLGGIEIFNQESNITTTFNNQYSSEGRKQLLLNRAPDLDLNHLPPAWRKARIIHLAPVAGELSHASGNYFPVSPVYYSLQGWLRDWDQDGLIKPISFPDLETGQTRPAGAFVSLEDIGTDRIQLDKLTKFFPLLVLTLGKEGAELYINQRMTEIHVPPSIEIDPTGAGDIFAAAFIIEKEIHGKTAYDSACFASALAAISVTRPGIHGIATLKEIQELYKVH
jgi:hypothetical protein